MLQKSIFSHGYDLHHAGYEFNHIPRKSGRCGGGGGRDDDDDDDWCFTSRD